MFLSVICEITAWCALPDIGMKVTNTDIVGWSTKTENITNTGIQNTF